MINYTFLTELVQLYQEVENIMLIDLVKIFCEVDDFYQEFEKTAKQELLQTPQVHQVESCTFSLSPSEIMTIVIAFHLSPYKTFKHRTYANIPLAAQLTIVIPAGTPESSGHGGQALDSRLRGNDNLRKS